jgi:hypothetical protein
MMKELRLERIDEDRIGRIGLRLHSQKGLLCNCGKDACLCCQRQFLYDMTERLIRARKPTAATAGPRARA